MAISFKTRYKAASLLCVLLAMGIYAALLSYGKTETPNKQAAMSADVAPGIILIDVLEGGSPEHYWQYELQPSSGTVRKVKKAEFRDYSEEDIPHYYQRPAGAGGCEHGANSPDGRFVARCQSKESFGSDGLQITDVGTSATAVYHWKAGESRDIRGFAWSPNSHSVAVLNVSEHYGKSPLELLWACSGHPVPHDTVFLDIIDMQKASLTEYLIQKNVIYSFTRILNWSD